MPSQQGMKAKILVVEDSPRQRAHLMALLRRGGYDVVEAAGGFEALRLVKNESPDAVLLDVMLEDLDGYSVCRMLRATDLGRDLGIIMLSAKRSVEERVKGLQLGADDYLAKPFNVQELDARIFAALRARADRHGLRRRNAELEGKLTESEKLARTDVLTDLVNRRAFSETLHHEWSRARRYGQPLSCALIDVDHFKQVNDRFGHAAGDETLRRIAELFRSSIRNIDIAARFAGDEFALLLPHTRLEGGFILLERIRAKLHAERGSWGGSGEVSLSIGVASNEDLAINTTEELLEAADEALYAAKRNGRDRVIAAPHAQHTAPQAQTSP
ncbi:MAG: diguanylate cyclase [Polyangiaceae bacterium]|nr:diguanylate cyclase [Polyangiaceae bacterium]